MLPFMAGMAEGRVRLANASARSPSRAGESARTRTLSGSERSGGSRRSPRLAERSYIRMQVWASRQGALPAGFRNVQGGAGRLGTGGEDICIMMQNRGDAGKASFSK